MMLPGITKSREELLKEIYDLYTSKQDKKYRYSYNMNNYKAWLRQKHEKHSLTNWAVFKKSHRYVKTIDIGQFCIRFAHLKSPPSDDLYYLLSVARDRYNRKQPVGAWIFNVIKASV